MWSNVLYKLLKWIRDIWFIAKFKLDDSGYESDKEELTCIIVDDTRETKRQDVLAEDDVFMMHAVVQSYQSRDPRTQVGACIVNPDKKVVGLGYNGFPTGCSDDVFPWRKYRKNLSIETTKDGYVCCAEFKALVNASETKDCTLYVNLFPCCQCAKMIIEYKIAEVVYMDDRQSGKYKASKKMFDYLQLKYRRYVPPAQSFTVDYKNKGYSAAMWQHQNNNIPS